jgi:hypothetical protein
MIAFAEQMPPVRVAVDLKAALFRKRREGLDDERDPLHRRSQPGRTALPRRTGLGDGRPAGLCVPRISSAALASRVALLAVRP